MRFSEIVKAWEDGYRVKFKNKDEYYGWVGTLSNTGIFSDNDNSIYITKAELNGTYELIKEPKKITFEDAFTNKQYANKIIYPECDPSESHNVSSWFKYFNFNDHLFPKLYKSMWIVKE